MVVPNRLTHLDVAIKAIWNFLHWITYSCCWKMQSQLLYFCILKELEVVCFLFPYSLIYSRNIWQRLANVVKGRGFKVTPVLILQIVPTSDESTIWLRLCQNFQLLIKSINQCIFLLLKTLNNKLWMENISIFIDSIRNVLQIPMKKK